MWAGAHNMYNFRPDAAPEPITQNYRLPQVSIDGQLRKVIAVIEMRGGNHAKDIREYEITSKGVVILGKRLTEYQGLISGIPLHYGRSDSEEESSQDTGNEHIA